MSPWCITSEFAVCSHLKPLITDDLIGPYMLLGRKTTARSLPLASMVWGRVAPWGSRNLGLLEALGFVSFCLGRAPLFVDWWIAACCWTEATAAGRKRTRGRATSTKHRRVACIICNQRIGWLVGCCNFMPGQHLRSHQNLWQWIWVVCTT